MAEYDDGAYYEVQLNNKQLVFFFMAALAIAVVVFLCGVMVGRGVHDATLAASPNDIAAGTLRPAAEARPSADVDIPALDYTSRLESDEREAKLEPAPAVISSSPESTLASSARSSRREGETTPESQQTAQAEVRPRPAPSPAASTQPQPAMFGRSSGPFTIQVVALKTPDAARSLLGRLQQKNYRAYLEEGGESGLHRVRVGRFATRDEAERVARKLSEEEKFKPYITH